MSFNVNIDHFLIIEFFVVVLVILLIICFPVIIYAKSRHTIQVAVLVLETVVLVLAPAAEVGPVADASVIAEAALFRTVIRVILKKKSTVCNIFFNNTY